MLRQLSARDIKQHNRICPKHKRRQERVTGTFYKRGQIKWESLTREWHELMREGRGPNSVSGFRVKVMEKEVETVLAGHENSKGHVNFRPSQTPPPCLSSTQVGRILSPCRGKQAPAARGPAIISKNSHSSSRGAGWWESGEHSTAAKG